MHSDFVKSLLQQCRSGILVDQSSSSAFPAGSFIQPTISIPGASDTKQYLLCGGSNGLYSEFISPVSATPLPTVSDMRELRLQCLSMLTTVLCGDALAAEYVLLALISRVYDRDVSFQGSDILLGHFPLLLSGFSKNDTHTQYILHRFVSQVTARSLLLPVDTISLLNGPALKPQRDSSMEFLQSSPLMLAADTTLILDETRESDLVSDQSEYQQVQASRQALLSVAEHQILPVQFPFHEVRLPVSTQLIMLTHSSRQSMFADSDQLVHVQLKPTSPAAESSLAQVTESLMDRLRMYFAQCRVGQATMLAETISMAEHDFISRNTVTRERNQVTESLSRVASDMMVEESEDDTTASPYESSSRLFHNWLTLVRLVALSQGDSEITPEHWVHMRALEAQRLNNLSSPLNIIGK